MVTYLTILSSPIIITGDINIRFDRPDDPTSRQLIDLLATFGLSQHVGLPTHDLGGILDAVITRSDLPAPSVSVIDVSLLDHRCVKFDMDLNRPSPVYDTFTKRSWRGFDIEEFRLALVKSPLCDVTFITAQTYVEEMTRMYNSAITNILERLAPSSEITRRKRKSDAWYDEDCRHQHRLTRELERRYRRSDQREDRVAWLASLKKLYTLFRNKSGKFWTGKMNREMTHGRRLIFCLIKRAFQNQPT